MTFFEFQKKFPNEGAALNFIVATKYANGYYCPKCGCFHRGIYRSNKRTKVLHCNNCKSEFSVLAGTIFEGTHLDLRMWLYAMNLVIVAKKGISACQLQRELGMKSYKGAWRMLQLIRQAMAKEEYNEVFEAVVEIDETYVGGKPRKSNVHTERETNEKFNKRGRGTSKTPVIGVKERSTGKVHAVVANYNDEGKQWRNRDMEVITKHEKTDFGDVWYMTSEPEGIFRFAIYRYDDDRKTIYLSNVFVGKEHRKNGLGNIILNAADKVAKKLKANTICLKVRQDSFVHDWYGRHGYTDLSVDDEEPQFIWMTKNIGE